MEKLEGLVAKNGGQAVVVEMGEEFRLLTLQVGEGHATIAAGGGLIFRDDLRSMMRWLVVGCR